MIEALEGIVVKELDYSETSKILDIITEKYGLISVISKGCKTLKSPLRSVSTKLIHGVFNVYYKKDKLSTLKSVDVIDNYKNIIIDLKKVGYASYLIELAYQVIKQNDNSLIYKILCDALKKIDDGFNPIVISDIVSLKYLEYLGVMPNLDCCSKCGSAKVATLSSDAGGYLCSNCVTNEPIVSVKAIKLVRMFYYVDIEKIDKLSISDDIVSEIHNFIDRYYERYTGLYFKSKRFLKVSE